MMMIVGTITMIKPLWLSSEFSVVWADAEVEIAPLFQSAEFSNLRWLRFSVLSGAEDEAKWLTSVGTVVIKAVQLHRCHHCEAAACDNWGHQLIQALWCIVLTLAANGLWLWKCGHNDWRHHHSLKLMNECRYSKYRCYCCGWYSIVAEIWNFKWLKIQIPPNTSILPVGRILLHKISVNSVRVAPGHRILLKHKLWKFYSVMYRTVSLSQFHLERLRNSRASNNP